MDSSGAVLCALLCWDAQGGVCTTLRRSVRIASQSEEPYHLARQDLTRMCIHRRGTLVGIASAGCSGYSLNGGVEKPRMEVHLETPICQSKVDEQQITQPSWGKQTPSYSGSQEPAVCRHCWQRGTRPHW